MEYEKKIALMRASYRSLLEKVGDNSLSKIHGGVDRKKLEEACTKIENEYVWVLKKRTSPA